MGPLLEEVLQRRGFHGLGFHENRPLHFGFGAITDFFRDRLVVSAIDQWERLFDLVHFRLR